jgi:hypothetical protein
MDKIDSLIKTLTEFKEELNKSVNEAPGDANMIKEELTCSANGQWNLKKEELTADKIRQGMGAVRGYKPAPIPKK